MMAGTASDGVNAGEVDPGWNMTALPEHRTDNFDNKRRRYSFARRT
jgi:hypothetical protein